jgi:antitoxin YefM
MEVFSYTHVRQNLKRVMDKVCADRAPVVVTRQNASAVVLMPLEEYHALEETLHLLSSPRNARRLARALESAEAGKLERHELIEE